MKPKSETNVAEGREWRWCFTSNWMGFAPLPQIVFTCKLPLPSLCEASLILRFYESYGMWMGRYVSMRGEGGWEKDVCGLDWNYSSGGKKASCSSRVPCTTYEYYYYIVYEYDHNTTYYALPHWMDH